MDYFLCLEELVLIGVVFLCVYLNGVKSSSESLTPKVGNALSIIDYYEPSCLSIFRCM